MMTRGALVSLSLSLLYPVCREPGADCGDRQGAGHAEEGALRQAEDLRLQRGDARHPVREAALQLAALRALGERGQDLRAPLRGRRVFRAVGGGGGRVRPASLHRERPSRAWHYRGPAVHRGVRQAPHQPLLLQKAHLRVQDHMVVKDVLPMASSQNAEQIPAPIWLLAALFSQDFRHFFRSILIPELMLYTCRPRCSCTVCRQPQTC